MAYASMYVLHILLNLPPRIVGLPHTLAHIVATPLQHMLCAVSMHTGGVGPMTIAILLRNTLDSGKRHFGNT